MKTFLDTSTHPITVVTGIKNGLDGSTIGILQATQSALATIVTFGELVSKMPGAGVGVAGAALALDGYAAYKEFNSHDGHLSNSTMLSLGADVAAVAALIGAGTVAAPVCVLAAAGLATMALLQAPNDPAIFNAMVDMADSTQQMITRCGNEVADFFVEFGLDVGDVTQAMADGLTSAIERGIDMLDRMMNAAGGALGGLEGGINDLLNDMFNAAQRYIPPRRDPLTLDLDGDGLETVPVSATNPILFDHNGDGIKTGTGWVKGDDGFLVLDRDGNGTIDSGRELFGDSTPLFDTEGHEIGKAADGFDALAQEDTNHDGTVNAQDDRWNDLRIWQDANQNGISEAGELRTMDAAGIASINVGKTEHSRLLPGGNEIADLGSYTRTDGVTGSAGIVAGLADVNFAVDTFHRSFTDSIPLTPEVETLPDMQGSGVLRDLREAASIPTSQGSELTTLLSQYAGAGTRSDQLAQLDALLIAWGATSDMVDMATRVAEHGYGFVTNLDTVHQARLLALEQFNGRGFYRLPWEDQTGQSGILGMTIGTDTLGQPQIRVNMNGGQISLLDQAWTTLRQSVYDGLLLQTRLKPYGDAISLTLDESRIGMDFTGTGLAFQARFDAAPAEAVRDLLDLQRISGANLNGLGWDGYGQLRDWLAGAAPTTQTALIPALADFGYPGLRIQGDGAYGNEIDAVFCMVDIVIADDAYQQKAA